MAQTAIRVGTEAANSVITTWTNEWKLNPNEGSIVAGFVDKPEVVGYFGQTIKVRFITAITAANMNQVANSASTTLTRANLNTINNNDSVASGSALLTYGYLAVNDNVWTQVRDDANYRSQQKKALMAGMLEKVDSDVFANAANLSNVITQADLDDAAFRNGYARLRKTAKSKMEPVGSADVRLFIPPEEVQNVFGIAALKEYQIRGSAGTAATGQAVNAYGIKWAVSGLVYTVGGVTAYCPLMLKDAWFLAYNRTPEALPDQRDGLSDHFLVRAEYATFEEFDSSAVCFALTIP